MLNMDFTVDLSVWQDGFTFQSDSAPVAETVVPRAINRLSFAEQLKQISVPEPEQAVAAPADLTAPKKVQEIPAALADVVDLTPFVVSADTAAKTSKPGERLNNQMDHTVFSKKTNKLFSKGSPYNLSEEKAKARETAQETKTLKAPENAKIFSMDKAARYRNNETKFGGNMPLAAGASEQAKQLRMEEMKQQAKAKTVNETNTTLARKSSIDPEAIRAQVGSEGFGYKRPNLPNTSSEKVSAAASWFPEAMTRQLDAYEAAKKVAQQGVTGTTPKNLTDMAI